MSRITDILDNLTAQCGGIDDYGRDYDAEVQAVVRAEQAITDFINEAIGEDEQVDFASTLNLNIDFHDDEAEARNELRHDIRTKLGLTTKEMN